LQKLILVILVSCAGAAFGQVASTSDSGGYKGPAVLDTVGYPIGRYVGQPINFRWHVGGHGSYSTGLSAATTSDGGRIPDLSSAGVSARAGVYGARQGKNSTTSVDFLAGYRYYTRESARGNDGADVMFGVNHRQQIDFKTSIGASMHLTHTGYSWFGAYTPTEVSPSAGLAAPAAQGFDSDYTSLGGTVGLTRSLTRRWRLNMQGTGFTTVRQSEQLLDSRGWTAGSNLMYSFSDRTSSGVGYRFSNFFTPGG
jgi:hypothetical protein